MRVVNENVARLIRNKHSGKASANTEVVHGIWYGVEISKVYLFGKHIADYVHPNGVIITDLVTLCNWPTATTADRLNALYRSFNRPDRVNISKGYAYYNGSRV